MNLISFLDFLGVLFIAYALLIAVRPEVRELRIFPSLVLLIILYAINEIPNFMEWLGYEALVEPFEEYVQILVPAAFFIVFTSAKFEASEEALSSRNKVLMAIHTITEKLQVGIRPEELWTELLGRVISVMGFEGGFISSTSGRNVVQVKIPWEGWEQFSSQVELLDLEETILSEVTMSRNPMIVEQADSVPDSFIQALKMSGVESVALFPVSSESRVLGVMGIVRSTQYTFSGEEIDLFTMLGRHLGEILHNSILMDGARYQAEDLRSALDGRRHFLTLISNDLREPLMRIRTVLQRLSEELPPDRDEDLNRILEEVTRDSEALEQLIDDVRELAILDSGDRRLSVVPVDIMKELRRAKEQFQLKAGDGGIDLVLRYRDDLPPLEADRDLLHSAMRHLLSNSIKYTPEGGQVVLSAWEEGNDACIQIRDTGIGIEEEDSVKIFDMFYRTAHARDKEKVGTGLGLTIVSRIVKLHGGTVRYDPVPEGGTVITVRMPRLQLED